jgi:hypothetical protein
MNPIRVWNRFWFGPISARPLGAFRVAFGLVTLASLGLLLVDLDYWFSDAGILRGSEARELGAPYRASVLYWAQDPTSVRVFFAITAVLGVLFTIGWRTRVVGVLYYLATLSIHHRDILTTSGADSLLMVLTFYMMLAPGGAAFSLDARRAARRRETPAEPLIVPWVQRLIQLQISLVYMNTAMLKTSGPPWMNGTALHYVLHNTEIGRFRLDVFTHYPLLVNLMTYGTLAIEFSLAFLLWFRATRIWAICGGIFLHGAILLTVNIPIFGELMIAGYLTFLTPEELDALLHAIDPRRLFARRHRQPPVIPGRVDARSILHGPHAVVESPTSWPVPADVSPAEWD